MTLPGCSVCTSWAVQAVEIKDVEQFELLQVARWRPLVGLEIYDAFFPHVEGGFRGRKLRVTSVDVSIFVTHKLFLFNFRVSLVLNYFIEELRYCHYKNKQI